MTETTYGLTAAQAPPPPSTSAWADMLRWCLAVMDTDDKDMGFVASLLSHAVKLGLSEKQAKYGRRVVDRLKAEWAAGELGCQQGEHHPA